MWFRMVTIYNAVTFQGGWECTVRRNMLGKQQQFVNHIVRLVKEVSQFGGSRNRKVSDVM